MLVHQDLNQKQLAQNYRIIRNATKFAQLKVRNLIDINQLITFGLKTELSSPFSV